ncbi:hypothetical protein [Chishuiella sp.]|uniref:hypothetical protein n=1 Tax=Chishuiella sp. TaxID=1969467 RepID=UPI0028ADA1BE|nr:hypothetical protein [Chishuiella sp.]
MTKVWFRCDGKNKKMFCLSSVKEMSYVPSVGDFIKTSDEDFDIASFRIKPLKNNSPFGDSTCLDFKVVSRTYYLTLAKWELICEPTPESLAFLLQNIEVK